MPCRLARSGGKKGGGEKATGTSGKGPFSRRAGRKNLFVKGLSWGEERGEGVVTTPYFKVRFALG